MCSLVSCATMSRMRRLTVDKSSLAIFAGLFRRCLFSVHFVRDKIDRKIRSLGECEPRARGRRVGGISGSERGTKWHSSAGGWPCAFAYSGCVHAQSCVRSLLCLPYMGLWPFQRVCSRIIQRHRREHRCFARFPRPEIRSWRQSQPIRDPCTPMARCTHA